MDAEGTIAKVFMTLGGVIAGVGLILVVYAFAKSKKPHTGILLTIFGSVFLVVGFQSRPKPPTATPATPVDELIAMSKEWEATDSKTLPKGDVALARGRKVGIFFRGGIDEWLHERHPDPIAAGRNEVGVVVLIDRETDATPKVYETGAKVFGSMFRCAAIAVPERVVIATWDRIVGPPQKTPQTRRGGRYYTAGAGSTGYEGLSHDSAVEDALELVAGKVPVGKARPEAAVETPAPDVTK